VTRGAAFVSSMIVATEPRVEIGTATRLFQLPPSGGGPYLVAPDAERFVIVYLKGERKPTALIVAVDWMAEGEP